MHSNLVNHIRNYIPLNDDEVAILLSFFQEYSFKKKTLLLREGQVCKSNYFVSKGCLRLYIINDKGLEQTTQFAIENWWISDHMSFVNQKPAAFNIQAVEDSVVMAIDKKAEEELLLRLPAMERYFRIILQKAYAASQFRIRFLFSQSGEERYNHFNNSYPDFVQRIPQYMLASFLNFTPEFLSKIRAKKS